MPAKVEVAKAAMETAVRASVNSDFITLNFVTFFPISK